MAAIGACLRQAAVRTSSSVLRTARPAAPFAAGRGCLVSSRGFSAAASKVSQVLGGELKHEQEQYEQAKEITSFLKSNSDFKLADKDGDVNMALEKQVGEKTVRIEFQLTSPFDPQGETEGQEEEAMEESTEFSVSVEDASGAGVTFYCSTQTGEDHRYVIGNVRTYASKEEKEAVTSYNGPEFEDLDDKVQEALDEYLGEVGVSSEVCDFVDAMASDKEQREYVRWLTITKKFLE
ncbi:unnamed protein product [Polarella glacialis]|uniref:Uncharacterized protein n=1 Tax=Polarella glacialis TaxID=89957 RepID=A0A813H4P7_POLGL|nr:unnamed protein product [Polarella glacialis]